jgi:hypothetical protein
MSPEVIDKLFELNNIGSINVLGITGGEPSLVPEIIDHLVDVINQYDVYIGHVDITVNGGPSVIKGPFLAAVSNFLMLASEPEYNFFAVSNSEYHDWQQDLDNFNRLSSVLNIQRRMRTEYSNLVCEGLAKEHQIAPKNQKTTVAKNQYSIQFDDWGDDEEEIETINNGELYVNANGWIIPGCDFSYSTQERIKTLNVMHEPLSNLIKYKEFHLE